MHKPDVRVSSLSATEARVNVQKFHETELCPEHKLASTGCLTSDRKAKGMNEVLANAGTKTTTRDTPSARRLKRNEMVKKTPRSYIDATVT